jgi:[ribosomal protein S5]-alanine N-acetyltransferase
VSGVRITTARLELIPASGETARAEFQDRARFAALLGARVPEEWPPPLNDEESRTWFLAYLERNPGFEAFGMWYFLLRGETAAERTVIGNGGFKGPPTEAGRVEIGYSLLEGYQGRGLATEAVRGLIGWAFGRPDVRIVAAQTLPSLAPSIRLLERSGFTAKGPGTDEGAILFELSRDAFERGAAGGPSPVSRPATRRRRP